MDFIKELLAFLKERKKFWLLPIIIVLLLFGVLIVLTSGSAIAPFIYAIF
jgi:competence protein ComGC